MNRQEPAVTIHMTWVATAIAAAFAMSACSSSDDDSGGDVQTGAGGGGGGGGGMTASGDYAVARNDGMNPGSVHFFSGGLDTTATVLATAGNQGIAFDAAGNLYQNSDAETATGLNAFAMAASRMANDAFDTSRDRALGVAPGKGLSYVAANDLLVSADVTDDAADLKIYAATAGSNSSPLTTIDTPASVWDTFHDGDSDTLYAALTDGRLAVFDDFSQSPGDAADRIVTPVDQDGNQVSVNFHGVFVADGVILVSDVGDAASATDGALFTFTESDDLDGDVTAFTRVAGAATLLGNPVDVILDGGAAIVAEKSNDKLLSFADVASLDGDVAPDADIDFIKPESIAFTGRASSAGDVSDIDSATTIMSVAVAQNPGVEQITVVDATLNADVGAINLVEANLTARGRFSAGLVDGDPGSQQFQTLENIQFDSNGNLFAVVETTDGASVSSRGIAVLHQPTDRVDGSLSLDDRDRIITGPDVGLTSPKGIEVVRARGMLIVADVGSDTTAPSLRAYDQNAGDNAAPMFTVTNVGDAAIWDIDYDPASDRLFAAGTAGDILVYDDFLASGASAVPARSIQPSTAGAVSNIHGIVHVSSSDQLIATDVGDAAVADDGRLYVIDAAASANGSIEPKATLAGPATSLGNPVDIAFDGANVFIAEKSNNQVLVYNDVLDLSGTLDVAADQSLEQTRPESVTLLP